MRQWSFATSTAVAALILCTAAQAQVTPEEVWESWQSLMSSSGSTVATTSVARDGDTLVVQGMTMTMDQAGNKMDASIDELKFRDKGDGTVEVTMSESYPIKMTMAPVAGETAPSDLTMTVSQPGIVVTAGGNATDTTYDFNAPSMTVDVQSVDPTSGPFNMTAAPTNVTGQYLIAKNGEASKLDSTFAAETMALSLSGKDDAAQSDVKISATMAGITGKSNGNFLGSAAMADMAAALKGGFAIDSGLAYGAMTFDVDVTEATGNTKITGTAESGDFNVAMDASRLGYSVTSKGVAVNIAGPEIPFPVNVTYGESAFNIAMPVGKSDTPSDFAFLTKIVDLTISDEIWAMIDPAGNLPRDPATVIIDTKGTARLTVDLMDEAAMAANGEAAPGELNSIDITELRASVAGAELTGAGALTFDNTDLVTFGGMPAPTGKIDLKLVGGNGLLDKLVAMGLIPEDQAMSARMMVSMFANPGAGPDELTSTLEFKDKGFFANGQRLQ
jgi:hypothetical protein